MTTIDKHFISESAGLSIVASVVPWDSDVFGFPVVQIGSMELTDLDRALSIYHQFVAWRDIVKPQKLVCRLKQYQLQESMLL